MTDTGSAIGASAPPVAPPAGPTAAQGSAALTLDQVKNYWIAAGGNPQAADMAAAVADAESGLNPNASRQNPDGTLGIGLWLIPQGGTPPGSTDPVANARAALQLSNNGQDWTQWCSTWSDNNCGVDGGSYLASGANALMSLGTQATPGSYTVYGASPSGNGTGASTATSSTQPSSSGSSMQKYVLIGLIVVAVIAVVYFSRKKTGEKPEPPPNEAGPLEK